MVKLGYDEYIRPTNKDTETQAINRSKQAVKEELKNYTELSSHSDLCYLVGSHIKYLDWDSAQNKYLYRKGGYLKFIKQDYIVLRNSDNKTWCVQKYKNGVETKFYKKNEIQMGGSQIEDSDDIELAIAAIQEREDIINNQNDEIQKLKQYIQQHIHN